MAKDRKPKSKGARAREKPKKIPTKSLVAPKPRAISMVGRVDEIRAAEVTKTAADQQLGADQVVQILADCIPRSGGNQNQIVMSNTLQSYGFDDQHEVDVLTSFIIGDADYGVRKYGFRLPGDALNFLASATVLSDLADAIEDKATPAP
jgi:hypothetical protein